MIHFDFCDFQKVESVQQACRNLQRKSEPEEKYSQTYTVALDNGKTLH